MSTTVASGQLTRSHHIHIENLQSSSSEVSKPTWRDQLTQIILIIEATMALLVLAMPVKVVIES
jgi:hypothetical protein